MGAPRERQDGEEPAGNSVGCCLRSIPWVHTLCSGLIIAALVIFITKSSLAFASVKALLVDLKVVGPVVKTASTLSSAALATGAAVTCMILLLAVIATIASMSGKARRYKVRHGMAKLSDYNSSCACCEVGTSVLVIFLMWIMLAAVVGLIALWTAFFLGSFSGDHGASYAMGTTDAIQAKIAKALKKADSVFTKMRSAWDSLVSRVPSFLKNNSWFTDLTRDIGGPLLAESANMTEVTCPENCLDLGVFSTMMSFEPRCVCGKEMLMDIKKRLRVSWSSTVWSLASLGVIAVCGSFILMACISSFVNSKRDVRDIKYAARNEEREAAKRAPPAPYPGASDVEMAAQDQMMGR